MEFLIALIAFVVWMIIVAVCAIVAIGVVMAVIFGIIAIFTTEIGNQVGAVLLGVGAILLLSLVL